MSKIEEFQKKGAISNFSNILESLNGMRNNCLMMVGEVEAQINEEEKFDNEMRAANGPKWTPLPSASMNQPYKQNIKMYMQKIEMARSQDESSQKRFNEQRSEIEILSKTKQELQAMMPVSESALALEQKPPALAIKTALDAIEAAKSKKEDLLREAVENLANLNMVEELMEIHLGKKQKEEVFTAKKNEFHEIFKSIAEQEQAIKKANEEIQKNFGDFTNLKKSATIDPTR